MSRFTAKLLIILDMIVMVVLFLIFHKNQGVMFLIALVCILISAILGHWLRCPSCGRGQGKAWLTAEYCPYCGEYLDDNW